MKKVNLANLCIGVMVLFFIFSCTKDDGANPVDLDQVTESGYLAKAKEQFAQLGYDSSDLTVTTFTDPFTKKTEEYYLLQGDVLISKGELKEMIANAPETDSKQFSIEKDRLISIPQNQNRTIRIYGVTGSSDPKESLTNEMHGALVEAVEKYRDESRKLRLDFQLDFGNIANGGDHDVIVKASENKPDGERTPFAIAQKPLNRNPGKFVTLYTDKMKEEGVHNEKDLLIIIMHEIGHTLGFKHTDYFNRRISCPSGGAESVDFLGVAHIPGTPNLTSVDRKSVFLACYDVRRNLTDFSQNDKKALRELYGKPVFFVVPTCPTIEFAAFGGRHQVAVNSFKTDWRAEVVTPNNTFPWAHILNVDKSRNGGFSVFVDSWHCNVDIGLLRECVVKVTGTTDYGETITHIIPVRQTCTVGVPVDPF